MSKRTLVPILAVLVFGAVAAGLFFAGGGDASLAPDRPDAPGVPEAEGAAVESPPAAKDEGGPVDVRGRVVALGREKPVPGATVRLGDGEAVAGEDGRFAIAGVPAGAATLRVAAEGYEALEREIAVASARADLGDVGLPSKTVLVVTVLDADAKPVSGATVRVLCRDDHESGSWWRGPAEHQIAAGIRILEEGEDPLGTRTLTGAEGTARIEGLAPGSYWIEAGAKGHGTAEAEGPAAVAPGGEAAATVRLPAEAMIAGRVVDLRKRAVPDARIVALPWNDAISFPCAPTLLAATAADGTFRVEGLADGVEYLILAKAANGMIGMAPQIEAPAEDVVIEAGPRFEVKGHVYDAETGEPLPGVSLYTILGRTTSGEDGSFDLKGMVKSPLLRNIWLRKEGYAPDQEQVELGASLFGAPVVTQDFRLSKVLPATLMVTVRDVSGRPVAGARVSARDWGEDDPHASATTDESGEAVLEKVEPGSVLVRAEKEGYVQIQYAGPRAGGGTVPTQGVWTNAPRGGEGSVSLDLSPVATLAGRVRDAEGNPLAGVSVRTGSGEVAETDAEGRYEAKSLPRGVSCRVWFGKEGYAPRSEEVVTTGAAKLDVVLDRGARILGTVVDGDGKKLGGVELALLRVENGSYEQQTKSGPEGVFEFGGLAGGTFAVRAERNGFAPAKLGGILLGEGQVRGDVRIVLTRGSRISFLLAGADGAARSGNVLVYGPLDGDESARILVTGWTRGEPFETRLAPGRYRILGVPRGADTAGAAEFERDLRAEEEVKITLPADGLRIRVRPVSPEGTKVVSMSVTRVEPAEPPVQEYFFDQDDDGVLETPPVPPGKYAVTWYYRKTAEPNRWFAVDGGTLSPGTDVREMKVDAK